MVLGNAWTSRYLVFANTPWRLMHFSRADKRGFFAESCTWLSRPARAYHRWQSTLTVWASWLGLLLAVITPPHGNGTTICWIKQCTGIDCPGCGMTRSLSCGLRGMFAESFSYHPFGLLVLALFLFTAVASLMPSARQRLAATMEARPVLFNGLYLAFVIAFVGFGGARALVELTQHIRAF
jgi:hypothetical protein